MELMYYVLKQQTEGGKGLILKTAVTLLVDGESVARGIAICNPVEPFSKKFGRQRSFQRAYKALVKEKSFNKARTGCTVQVLFIAPFMKFKCEFMPELTRHEQDRIIRGGVSITPELLQELLKPVKQGA